MTHLRTHSRAVIGVVLVAVVLAAAIVAARAADTSGRKELRPNRQTVAWQRRTQTTTSDRFVDVPGLSNLFIKHRGAVSVTVSANFMGEDIELRVAGFKPAKAFISPAGAPPGDGFDSRSFTFVTKGSREATCLPVDVQWRSPNGGEAKLDGGTVVVSYRYVGDEKARSLGCV